MKLTWDEMTGVNPGVSIIRPFDPMQSFSLGVGATGSAHSTRLETITFIWENRQLIEDARLDIMRSPTKSLQDCRLRENGVMIDSDLKIGEFIYDKATIAKTGIASTDKITKYSVYQEDLTFVLTYGANITPTWRLTRISANTSSNLISATRSTTGDVLITLGPLANKGQTASLADPAASQHTAVVNAGATATQIMTLSR